MRQEKIRIQLSNTGKLQVISPYSDVTSLRSVPGGEWNKSSKLWEYPQTSVIDLLHVFKGRLSVTKDVDTIYKRELNKQRTVQALIDLYRNHWDAFPEHPFLMKHQYLCSMIADTYDKFAFFAQTGTGKTLTALDIIHKKQKRFLIIAPKPTIKDAWLPDAARWYPDMRLMPLSRNITKADMDALYTKWVGTPPYNLRKAELQKRLSDMADSFVINAESYKQDIKLIQKLGIEGLVFDEAALLRNGSSAITKAVSKFADTLRYGYFLTGEPDPNGKLEYFHLMKMIDPAVLGRSFTRWREVYFYPGGFQGKEWFKQPDAEARMTPRLAKRSVVIRKDECLDLPPETVVPYTVELSATARRYYMDMLRHNIVELQDSNVAAKTKATVGNKLRQIASGLIIDTANSDYKWLHNDSINALLELLDTIGNEQVIIWGTFRDEIAMIEEVLTSLGKTVVTAYGRTKNVDDSIKAFKAGEAQYLVANPKSIKYGITLVNCSYAVYYSYTENYDDYLQSRDRILRKGQTRPCTIYFMMKDVGIDKATYKTLVDKADFTEIVRTLIEEYSMWGDADG